MRCVNLQGTGLEGCGVVLVVCTGYQTDNYANY